MSPTAVHGDKCPATFPCQDISSDVDGQNAVLIVMVAQTSDQAQAWLETVQISDKLGTRRTLQAPDMCAHVQAACPGEIAERHHLRDPGYHPTGAHAGLPGIPCGS